MKIFLDTADVDQIRQAVRTGLVDGVTTNPSHVLKAGRPFHDIVREICAAVPGHVSAEAVADTTEDLVAEAQRIARLAPQIVVKMPMTPAGLGAVRVLEQELKIRTNVTMVFSPTQAFLAMKQGASFVSIVLSRLENVGHEASGLIQDTMRIKQQYGLASQVIAGSIKTQPTLLACLRAGVDIATIPVDLFRQMFEHPLTTSGLDQFQKDWQKVPRPAGE